MRRGHQQQRWSFAEFYIFKSNLVACFCRSWLSRGLLIYQHCMNQLTDRKTTTFCHSACLAVAHLHVFSKMQWNGIPPPPICIPLSKILFGQWTRGNLSSLMLLRLLEEEMGTENVTTKQVKIISAFLCNLLLLKQQFKKWWCRILLHNYYGN